MSSKKLSSAEQKKLTEQLQTLTNATSADAARILKASKWNINVAVEAFFGDYAAQANAAARGGADARAAKDGRDNKLKAIFRDFEDPDQAGSITIETIAPYFEAIGITDMDSDIAVYLVSYELKSATLGQIDLAGFQEGWGALRIDTLAGMKSHLPTLKRKYITDPEYFKKVYKYVFTLGRAEGAKVVVREMAVGLWSTILPPVFAASPSALVYSTPTGGPGMGAREFGWWTEFLEKNKVKGVSKDVWDLYLEFMIKVPSSFDSYEDDGAWPSILDEFYEYGQERRKKEGDSMDLS